MDKVKCCVFLTAVLVKGGTPVTHSRGGTNTMTKIKTSSTLKEVTFIRRQTPLPLWAGQMRHRAQLALWALPEAAAVTMA